MAALGWLLNLDFAASDTAVVPGGKTMMQARSRNRQPGWTSSWQMPNRGMRWILISLLQLF